MNFISLQEKCWEVLGSYDNSDRPDYRRQQIRDAINQAQDELANNRATYRRLVRENMITMIPAQATYILDDWTRYVLELYTTGIAAHKVEMLLPRYADRSGYRIPVYGYGQFAPYHYTQAPKTPNALYSGATATVAANGTVVTLTDGAAAVAASLATGGVSMVGRMLRLNGEDGDYRIVTVTPATPPTVTVDRPVMPRISGPGFNNGVGGGMAVQTGACVYSAGGFAGNPWQVSPPGRLSLQLLPAPTIGATTWYYRCVASPRRLLNDTDVPEIDDDFHHLLWKGALRSLHNTDENNDAYQRAINEFGSAMNDLDQRDSDEFQDSEGRPNADTSLNNNRVPIGVPPGVVFRNRI